MSKAWLPCLALAVALSIHASAALDFVHGPYSGAPSGDSVVVSWSASEPVPARVEFAERSKYELTGELTSFVDVPVAASGETIHVTLGSLEPASDYVYRVVLIQTDSKTASPTGAFSTPARPGDSVSFAVLADTQQQLSGTNRLALVGDAVAADPTDFDFILHAGDLVESPTSFYWGDWFTSFADMLLRAPLLPVLGNHEANHSSYFDTFAHPPGAGRETAEWWALHWGDVVIVGLNTNATSLNAFRAQRMWAEEHLSGSEPHKFVLLHHPPFSSGIGYEDVYVFDEIFHPVFVNAGVDVVLSGHTHHYERIERDGVIYLVVGGGGAAPRRTAPAPISGSEVIVEGAHFYVRVTARAGGIDVETIAVARELPDGTCASTLERLDAFKLESTSSSVNDD